MSKEGLLTREIGRQLERNIRSARKQFSGVNLFFDHGAKSRSRAVANVQRLPDDIKEALDNFENEPSFEKLVGLAWKLKG